MPAGEPQEAAQRGQIEFDFVCRQKRNCCPTRLGAAAAEHNRANCNIEISSARRRDATDLIPLAGRAGRPVDRLVLLVADF